MNAIFIYFSTLSFFLPFIHTCILLYSFLLFHDDDDMIDSISWWDRPVHFAITSTCSPYSFILLTVVAVLSSASLRAFSTSSRAFSTSSRAFSASSRAFFSASSRAFFSASTCYFISSLPFSMPFSMPFVMPLYSTASLCSTRESKYSMRLFNIFGSCSFKYWTLTSS